MKIMNLGLIDYSEAYDIQKTLVKERLGGQIEDALIVLEHFPVITVGRDGKKKNILINDAELESGKFKLVYTDRGGDVTLHCPGQLVVYPIVDLKEIKCDLHWYMRKLEEVVIRLLKLYNITGFRKESFTGVWTGDKEKIASIGIGARNWVTCHGLALNVNTDLQYFSNIIPCGIENIKMTSMKEILNKTLDMNEVSGNITDIFQEILFKNNFCENISEYKYLSV